MKNFIKFTDTVDFVPIEIPEQKLLKDNYLSGPPNRPLIVKIAATHAGLITRNNGFYLPDRMRKGATTFVSQYPKPVQTHHSDDQDPVGRVIKAEYIDISASVTERINNKKKDFFTKFTPDSFNSFTDGRMPYIESVNFICDFLNKKDSLLDDPDFQGLGYILITAQISDSDAIQKILDGRYLTGSVGLTTDRAVCSVCKQDWTDSGKCEHTPGKRYDGVKAFIITGDLVYDEYSFVNTPADRHSRVMEVNVNGVTDSVTMDESVGTSIAVNLITDNITQEDTMDEDKIAVTKVFELADEAKLEAIKLIRPHMEETALVKIIADKHTDVEAFYTALTDAEWADYSELEDEGLIQYLVDHAEDKKLTPAQRKRLPGSSFCGPNKSFPIPDATHVESTKRLLDKASISPAIKARIMVVVDRKALALVVPPVVKEEKKEDKKEENGCTCKAQIDELTTARDSAITERDTIITELQTSKGETVNLQKDLLATREELKAMQDDLTQMMDQLITVKSESTNYLVDKLIVFRVLSGEVMEDQVKVKEELSTLAEDTLKDELTKITAKVDMNKITDSINSGLTRKPNGSVDDPTLGNPAKKIYDKKYLDIIAEEYNRILFGGQSFYGRGKAGADQYIRAMQGQGLLPTG